MNSGLIEILTNIGGLGVLALFIITLSPIFKSLARKMDAKINGGIPYDVSNGIQKIETNHLHTLQESMNRIEHKLDKLDSIENLLIEIRTKVNK